MSALARDLVDSTAGARGRALVVDDETTNRLVLKSILTRIGFTVELAENGREAAEMVEADPPDIVFLDVRMPVMDGYEAVGHIKAASAERFIPVIFLTAITDEDGLARCIDAGDDDFLTKPFDSAILASKVRAFERIRELHAKVGSLYRRERREAEIAGAMYSRAVSSGNVALDAIGSLHRPAATFSGDVFVTAHAPSGDLHVLLGDFTGHGLAAALGALPAAEVFRAMTAKGFSIIQILDGINAKLHRLLPTGMFMAARFLCVHAGRERITICNCGMPGALVPGAGGVRERVRSAGLPLGVFPSAGLAEMTVALAVEPDDHVALVSDGVLEARDAHGEEFGAPRYERTLLGVHGGEGPAARYVRALADALDAFRGTVDYDDDVSALVVPCTPETVPARTLAPSATRGPDGEPGAGASSEAGWRIEIELEGARLHSADPVPLLIGQILELDPIEQHAQTLFTVLSELHVNALDHGVLGLDSALKCSPKGFERYLTEREARLTGLDGGRVCIAVRGARFDAGGGRLVVCVTDSGPGFDWSAVGPAAGESALSGRGVSLVRSLCGSLTYHADGNVAEAVYDWH